MYKVSRNEFFQVSEESPRKTGLPLIWTGCLPSKASAVCWTSSMTS